MINEFIRMVVAVIIVVHMISVVIMIVVIIMIVMIVVFLVIFVFAAGGLAPFAATVFQTFNTGAVNL